MDDIFVHAATGRKGLIASGTVSFVSTTDTDDLIIGFVGSIIAGETIKVSGTNPPPYEC